MRLLGGQGCDLVAQPEAGPSPARSIRTVTDGMSIVLQKIYVKYLAQE